MSGVLRGVCARGIQQYISAKHLFRQVNDHKDSMMNKKFWFWLAWFGILLILNFTLPFTALSNIPSLYGSFLFWVVWGLVAIISMFFMFLGWREKDHSGQRSRS